MSDFWRGFFKRAAEDPSVIADWVSEARLKNKELKNKPKDRKVDPRELSVGYGTEAWHRQWWP
jgi:hypothetical protein